MIRDLTRLLLLFVGLPVGLALLFGAPLWPLLLAYTAAILLMMCDARDARGRSSARSSKLGGVAFFVFLVFGLPLALASAVGPTMRALLIAYAIWFGLLGLWAVVNLRSRGVGRAEAIGWPVIFSMFLTVLVVPVLTLVLTVTGAA